MGHYDDYGSERPAPPLVSDAWKRSPGKKDTRRWCRGKVGVEHELEVNLQTWALSMKYKCGWRKWRRDVPHWSCYHQSRCVKCGKIMEHWLSKDTCPDYAKLPE